MSSRYGLEIRRADASDAPGLAELLCACDLPADPVGIGRGLQRIDASGGAALLALEWGPPSGALVYSIAPTLDGPPPIAIASLLIVDPQARRRGIARMLLKSASQAARQAGCGSFRLLLPPDAEIGRAFAPATGFEEAGAVLDRPLRKRG